MSALTYLLVGVIVGAVPGMVLGAWIVCDTQQRHGGPR